MSPRYREARWKTWKWWDAAQVTKLVAMWSIGGMSVEECSLALGVTKDAVYSKVRCLKLPKSRGMGLLSQLTDDQKAALYGYTGPINQGDAKFRRAARTS